MHCDWRCMLASTKHIQQGNTRLAYHLALGPGFRLISVEREGLSYDSSLAPASHAPSTGCLVLYVVLEGGFCPSHRFVATLGPSAWLVHEDHIDGALGHRPHSLLTFGQRFRSITLHIDAQHCRVAREPHGAPQELVLAPGLREACEHYAQQVHRVDGATWRDEARLLLQAIVDAGWIDADVMRTLSLFEA